MAALPPLIPRIGCVILLSTDDGSRLYSKYYSPRFTAPSGPSSPDTQALRLSFEKALHKRTRGHKSESGVSNVEGVTTVHKTMGDVKVFVGGPQGESELVLSYVLESFCDALQAILTQVDRQTILHNLELLLLLLDECIDAGMILESDPRLLADRVLMRGAGGAKEDLGDMTLGQAFNQVVGRAMSEARESMQN